MRALLRSLAFAMALLVAGSSLAGTTCREVTPTPQQLAESAAMALRVTAALEARDAPVALIARAGTDLSKYGLHYSHAGFAVRDHADGRWTVVHLLNRCGTDRSGVYAQGLVNFFADDLVSLDARIVWFDETDAQALLDLLQGPRTKSMHQPKYNLIARYDSRRTQNSTAWVLDMLGAARGGQTRTQAQHRVLAEGFEPDVLKIPYSKRIAGGLFGANLDFTDHPVATRLRGEYPVVTVRSILRYLERIGIVESTLEWRSGIESRTPGSA